MSASESLSIDSIIDKALCLCEKLPEKKKYTIQSRNIKELRDRLSNGRLQVAVLGQFNRGKSTFINSLLRMQVLPSSVLPITSVPTVISYDKTNQCTISFSNNQNDITIRDSTHGIVDLLMKYVTEKNNPENLYHVSKVSVKCNSLLLQHGTVIIDTPGFGSTIAHNTQTTLDLLSSCDASLFIFSADLPITQTEVSFLKKVIKTVPRIFFIYNKIDLLTGKEQKVSMQFIKDTLVSNLEITSGVQLFPVSAKMVNLKENENKTFIKSGIARVEKEIIEFLVREKYFTLSQALTNKFKDAVTTIKSNLITDRLEMIVPISKRKEEIEIVKKLLQKSRDNQEKAIQFYTRQQKKLFLSCHSLLAEKKEELQILSQSRLKEILISISGNKPDKILILVLSHLCEEMFKRLWIFLITECNKPLRKMLLNHRKELKLSISFANTQRIDPIQEDENLEIRLEQIQMDSSNHWKSNIAFTLTPLKQSFFDRFIGYDKRYLQLVNHYSKELIENINQGIDELKKSINSIITIHYESFMYDIKNDYERILLHVTSSYDSLQAVLENEQNQVKDDVEKLDWLIKGFQDVEGQIF